MIPRSNVVLVTSLLLLGSSHGYHVSTRRSFRSSRITVVENPTAQNFGTSLYMQPSSSASEDASSKKRRIESLSAVAITADWQSTANDNLWISSSNNNLVEDTILPVLSTSLLITGNTVGAGMLVLPELAAGPGMAISTSIFIAAFIVNLISGLLIAEVAIHQHDTSGSDVPSSFKDFAQANLNSDSAANIISGISVFVNALVLAFNTVKVGEVGSASLSGFVASNTISMLWALCCVVLVGTQSFTSLSTVTSLLVSGLFVSFAGVLIPGLANMSLDPMTLLMTPGTSPDVMASACQLAPIVLMSLVYQNIVPTVTKLLNYDRTKTAVAIGLGSFLPLGMYIAWAFAVVGGGVDTSFGLDGPLMTLFSLTTIAGSSIGCTMSLSEEFDTFLKPKTKKTSNEEQQANFFAEEGSSAIVQNDDKDDKFSLPAVLASVACAVVASQFFADDLNGALKVAGSFGSPLLYGLLPVVMAWTQRQTSKNTANLPRPMLPNMSLGILGAASTGFVGNEVLQSAQDVLASVPL